MDKIQNTINFLELDIAEIEKLIKLTTRSNIKRQFEEYKNTLTNQLEAERKFLQIETKRVEENKSEPTKPETTSINYQTINKYSIDNTKDLFKFIKFNKLGFICLISQILNLIQKKKLKRFLRLIHLNLKFMI